MGSSHEERATLFIFLYAEPGVDLNDIIKCLKSQYDAIDEKRMLTEKRTSFKTTVNGKDKTFYIFYNRENRGAIQINFSMLI